MGIDYFKLPGNVTIDTLHFSQLVLKIKINRLIELKENDTIIFDNSSVKLDVVVLNIIILKEFIVKNINKIDDNYINTHYNLFRFLPQLSQNYSKINLKTNGGCFCNYRIKKNLF